MPREKKTCSRPDAPVLYLGIDLGKEQTTVFAGRKGDLAPPLQLSMPTVIAYDTVGGSRRPLLGREAFARRDELRLLAPLHDPNPYVRFDFVRALREAIDPGFDHQLWGVVQLTAGASPATLRATREIASELLDRSQLVDGAVLAVEEFDARQREHCAVSVDFGSDSVRVTPVRSGVAGDTIMVPFGSLLMRRRFHDSLRKEFPDASLSAQTVRELLESLGRLGATLDRRRQQRLRDIATLATDAWAPLLDDVLHAIARALDGMSAGRARAHLRGVRAAGGLTEIPGFAETLRQALAQYFGEETRLLVPELPSFSGAAAALRWAHRLPGVDWRTPVFSFAA